MRSVLLATIASLGLVGCVGSFETGNPTPDDNDVGDGSGTNPNPQGENSVAKKMFEDNVYPIISDKTSSSGCAAVGCHMIGNTPGSTQFVAQTKEEGWATITSFTAAVGAFTPSTAGILTKLEIAPHNSRSFSPEQKQLITDWLAQEALERANGGGGTGGGGTGTESPGAATARLMNAWSSCLSVTDFQTANMTNAWQNMTAGGSACRTCHGTGAYNMIITPIVETDPAGGPPGMFTTIATVKEYMIMWFTVDLSVTGADGKKGKIIINQTAFDGVANGVAPHSTHPRFNSTNNNGMTALKSWYDLTMAKVTAAGATGNCGPTKLDPPAM